MNKHTLPAVDSRGNQVDLTITVVDNEAELWQLEEPPEPVILVTKERGGGWMVYGESDDAYCDGFGDREWPRVLYGGDDMQKEEAVEYAKRWARAVRGVWEEI